MPDQPPSNVPQWSRRRFLKAAGAATVGVAAVGALAVGLERAVSPPAPAASAAPSGSPAASGPILIAAASGSPPASGAPSPGGSPAPGASASPSAAPSLGRRSFRTRPDLTPPVVGVNLRSGGTAPGSIFFTPADGGTKDGPAIVDDSGEPIWLRPSSGKGIANFRVWDYEGQPVLTWWEGDNNNGIGAGELVIADRSYRELKRMRGPGNADVDLHEFQITSRGTALFFADKAVPKVTPAAQSPASGLVMDCVLEEVDIASGRVFLSWHSADHIDVAETYVAAPTGADQVYDYVHANSIAIDSDGGLLVSARNTSAIYKLDRSSGAIVWRLGGKRSDFTMGPGTAFGWQHDARRQPDGTLSLFDDQAAPGHSRGLVLRLDETARTATLVREYLRPTQILATSQGNMQLLPNGDLFVGWGSQPFFSEFAADGTLRYDATFPAAKQSYRCFRFEWTATPTEPPAVIVTPSGNGGVTAYVSWNGSTNVATWDLLAGTSVGDLSLVATEPRSGFETQIEATTAGHVFAVQARDASGRLLVRSAAVTTSA